MYMDMYMYIHVHVCVCRVTFQLLHICIHACRLVLTLLKLGVTLCMTLCDWYLQGVIQELLIVPDAGAAFQTCDYFTPDCTRPFPRGNESYYSPSGIETFPDQPVQGR